jgi:hypothetical protein
MTLLMRDSTNPFDIPLDNLAAVAGYGDGIFQWTPAGWARFPASIVPLSIVVNAGDIGDILDVETGAASPDQTAFWADRFNRVGRRAPTIYCNRNTIGAVQANMAGRRFDWWAATLDGTQDVAGAVAVQYAGENLTGGHYDESVIHDPSWLGIAPPPSQPLPTPEVKQRMIIFSSSAGEWLLSGSLYVHVINPTDSHAIQAAGVQLVQIDDAQHQALLAGSAALQGALSGQLNVSGSLRVGP